MTLDLQAKQRPFPIQLLPRLRYCPRLLLRLSILLWRQPLRSLLHCLLLRLWLPLLYQRQLQLWPPLLLPQWLLLRLVPLIRRLLVRIPTMYCLS